MKDKYSCRQTLFLINQLAIIIYFVFLARNNITMPNNALIQLGITTLILFNAFHVSYKNIRNNTTLTKFALLQLIVTWYFLLGFCFDTDTISEICKILLSLILFQLLSFTLTFLFQDHHYKYKNTIYIAMSVSCGTTILFKFISEYTFNFFLLVQFVLTALTLFFVAIVHRKRINFILKNHKAQLCMSFVFVLVPFFLYSMYFINNAPQLDNIGTYMFCVLCFASVHNIIFSTRQLKEKSLSISPASKVILVSFALLSIVLFEIIFELPIIAIFVFINTAHLFLQLYNVLLYLQTHKKIQSNESYYPDFYSYSLSGIKNEERLKTEMSEFLHDNVLQDILSIKILLNKSEKPEVRQLIAETLEKLNFRIRTQMQQYHSVLLKSLTLKENYKNLIETTSRSFPLSKAEFIFNCPEDLFLADPYNIVIYRIMKELITNSLKHSAPKTITVNLSLKKDLVTLEVFDNGIGFDTENWNCRLHKGLVSVYDTVCSLA